MHTEAFERAVVAVEEAVDRCRGQQLSAEQFGWRTVDAFLAYLDEEDPRDDVESFIGAVRRLVDDPAERAAMGARGRDWVEHEASPGAVGDAYHELVQGLATRRPDRPSR